MGGARNIVLSLDRTRIHNIEEKCSGNERNLVRGRIIAGFLTMSRGFIVFSYFCGLFFITYEFHGVFLYKNIYVFMVRIKILVLFRTFLSLNSSSLFFVLRFPPITVIKKPSKFEGFHFIYKQINYFAASPQAGTTVFISGLSIFIEHAIT